jgi:hypothetical protein
MPETRPKRKGPGLAVMLVILYGLLFLAALVWMRVR